MQDLNLSLIQTVFSSAECWSPHTNANFLNTWRFLISRLRMLSKNYFTYLTYHLWSEGTANFSQESLWVFGEKHSSTITCSPHLPATSTRAEAHVDSDSWNLLEFRILHIHPITYSFFKNIYWTLCPEWSPRSSGAFSSEHHTHTCYKGPTREVTECVGTGNLAERGWSVLFAPAAYGKIRGGQIRAAVASLRHSHGNTGSELHLQTIPQLTATLGP